MVVDTSALVAIFLDEAERPIFEDLILRSPVAVMSVVSHVECSIALVNRLANFEGARLDKIMETLRIDVHAVDGEQGRLARAAFARYGRGRHPAKLNFGDCFSYALAKFRDDTLLFKGDDFSKTDITAAWRTATTF